MSHNWHRRVGVAGIGWEHRFEDIPPSNVTVKLLNLQQRGQYRLESIIIFKSGHKHGPVVIKINQFIWLAITNQYIPAIFMVGKRLFTKVGKWKWLGYYITVIFVDCIKLEKRKNSCM